MRFLFLAWITVCSLTTHLLAQIDPPEVDQAEVMRLGDTVQHVGEHASGEAAADAFISAMSPPESDADKWFISVVTEPECTACNELLREWDRNPWLQALADPSDPKRSWAHYNRYDKADESQAFRWKQIQITSYPTILVQPPLSGTYGDSSTVVYQGVYSGDPQALARGISYAIRRYITRLQTVHEPAAEGLIGQSTSQPPWNPSTTRPITPPSRDPIFPRLDPTIPPPSPAELPSVPFPWTAVLTLLTAGFSIPAVCALVIWAVTVVRARRKETGKRLLLSDQAMQQLIDLLERLSQSSPQPSSSGQ